MQNKSDDQINKGSKKKRLSADIPQVSCLTVAIGVIMGPAGREHERPKRFSGAETILVKAPVKTLKHDMMIRVNRKWRIF